MKKNIITYIVCTLLFGSGLVQAQSYSFHSKNPFGLDLFPLDTGEVSLRYQYYDRDNDGDMDLFGFGFVLENITELSFDSIEYFIDYQENMGTAHAPEFGPRVRAFDTFEFHRGPFLPTIGDLNNDGQFDILALSEIEFYTGMQNVSIYLNKPNPNNDKMDRLDGNDFGLGQLKPNSFIWPELVDIDMDGDLDLIGSGNTTMDFNEEVYTAVTSFSKNIGTNSNPRFIGWFENPFNIKSDTLEEMIKLGDLDNDGDPDALSIVRDEEGTKLFYKENILNHNGRPLFDVPVESPFNLPTLTAGMTMIDFQLVDIDGDGDLDFMGLIFDENEEELAVHFYENDLCEPVSHTMDVSICDGDSYDGYTSSGSYSDSFSSALGCDSVRILNLTVLDNSASLIAMAICNGEDLVVGDTILTLTGNYEIIIPNSYGCDSVISVNLDVISPDTSVLVFENTLMAAPDHDSYQWIDCSNGNSISGEINSSFTATESGSYAVMITEMNCTEMSQCYEVIVSSTSENEIAKSIQLYPNPTSDIITIRSNDLINFKRMRVYDLSGKLMYNESSFNNSISVKDWNEGLYMLFIEGDDYTVIKKFSVLR